MIKSKLKQNLNKTITEKFPSFSLRLRNLMKRGFENEMLLLPYLCSKKMNSVDIGANFGLYSYRMLNYSLKVFSFEPIPYLYNNLTKAFKRKKNIELYNAALSDSDHSGKILSPEYTHGWSTLEAGNPMLGTITENERIIEFPVEVRRLDSYGFQNISLIKIDVEGHEYNTVNGARKTIEGSKPSLLIEIEEKHKTNSVNDVIGLIKSIEDYSVFNFLENKLLPFGTSLNAQKHAAQNGSHYFYNYIFIHNSKIRDLNPGLFL